MALQHESFDRRSAIDARLTELMLYAKDLCPGLWLISVLSNMRMRTDMLRCFLLLP